MARVSIHAIRSVPDNHNKFAIAVTRARVDSPSFLLFIPPVVICLHQLAARSRRRLRSKDDAMSAKVCKNQQLQCREPVYWGQSVRPSYENSM
jgi:hypothetical protein